jgi:hypothetical protein
VCGWVRRVTTTHLSLKVIYPCFPEILPDCPRAPIRYVFACLEGIWISEIDTKMTVINHVGHHAPLMILRLPPPQLPEFVYDALQARRAYAQPDSACLPAQVGSIRGDNPILDLGVNEKPSRQVISGNAEGSVPYFLIHLFNRGAHAPKV